MMDTEATPGDPVAPIVTELIYPDIPLVEWTAAYRLVAASTGGDPERADRVLRDLIHISGDLSTPFSSLDDYHAENHRWMVALCDVILARGPVLERVGGTTPSGLPLYYLAERLFLNAVGAVRLEMMKVLTYRTFPTLSDVDATWVAVPNSNYPLQFFLTDFMLGLDEKAVASKNAVFPMFWSSFESLMFNSLEAGHQNRSLSEWGRSLWLRVGDGDETGGAKIDVYDYCNNLHTLTSAKLSTHPSTRIVPNVFMSVNELVAAGQLRLVPQTPAYEAGDPRGEYVRYEICDYRVVFLDGSDVLFARTFALHPRQNPFYLYFCGSGDIPALLVESDGPSV